MFIFYLKHLKLLRVSGILIPFKIAHKTRIKIHRDSQIKLGGRLSIGNKKLQLLSTVASNLNFGKKSEVEFEHSVSLGPGVNLITKQNAQLKIGHSTYFTSDAHIEAVKKISIGSNCAISWGVTIIDSNHHEIFYKDKKAIRDEEVNIGDHVWIGCNCTILKGTSIGNNSVVAAGSVVSGSFPPNSLIGGNPAKVIRSAINWE